MKLIKLTTFFRGVEEAVYVNPNHIGHFYNVPEIIEYGRVEKRQHTRVGVTTHNNGGFEVLESVEQIIKLIEQS
jgi:hypothetical protein